MQDNVRSRRWWSVAVSLVASVSWAQDDQYRIPPTVERAMAGAEVVLLGRLQSVKGEMYKIRGVIGPDGPTTSTIPSTAFKFQIVEVFKGDEWVKSPDGTLVVRAPGLPGGDTPAGPPPSLKVGSYYVVFLVANRGRSHWLRWGSAGVFEQRAGTVVPGDGSAIGKAWAGKKWDDFVDAVRKAKEQR